VLHVGISCLLSQALSGLAQRRAVPETSPPPNSGATCLHHDATTSIVLSGLLEGMQLTAELVVTHFFDVVRWILRTVTFTRYGKRSFRKRTRSYGGATDLLNELLVGVGLHQGHHEVLECSMLQSGLARWSIGCHEARVVIRSWAYLGLTCGWWVHACQILSTGVDMFVFIGCRMLRKQGGLLVGVKACSRQQVAFLERTGILPAHVIHTHACSGPPRGTSPRACGPFVCDAFEMELTLRCSASLLLPIFPPTVW